MPARAPVPSRPGAPRLRPLARRGGSDPGVALTFREKLRWRREFTNPPVTSGNTFTLLAGGPAIYAALRASIRRARREILLVSYIWNDDATGRSFLAELTRAARRGVRVRIIVDGVGSYGLGAAALRPLIRAGGAVGIFRPVRLLYGWSRLMRRNHRKLAVFDGVTAYIGGFGYGDEWAESPPKGWWDLGARVTGPVTDQFRRVIARDWIRCRQPPLPDQGVVRIPHAGRQRLRLLPSVFGRHDLFRRLRRAAHPARERVFICTTYFIPSLWIRHALRRAARRGVDVRLLLPGPRIDHVAFRFANRRLYGTLLTAGVRIFEYQPTFLHAKYALVDRNWGLIGSSNLDSWSGRLNLEADLEVKSRSALRTLASRFLLDLRVSREITHARWSQRALWVRLLERFIGRFDPWL